jgi:arginyl-tRNA synthetase
MTSFSITEDISDLIKVAIEEAIAAGVLPELAMPEILVERVPRPEHGDYATNVALKLKRAIPNSNPMRIAEIIRNYLKPAEYLAAVEVAAPGFINFHLTNQWLTSQVRNIIEAGQTYGDIDLGKSKRIQVEYVSANPTGPITIASARGAAIGDALSNLLQAAGYQVEREFYVNDMGSRMEVFNKNCWYYYLKLLDREATPPAESYPPAQFAARLLVDKYGDKYAGLPEEEGRQTVGKLGIQAQVADMKACLERMGVTFDQWFHEQNLFDNGTVDTILKLLRDNGHVAEREGATWFISSALGQDKDNVLVRSNGLPTYFVSDIAYHYNKFEERGFEKVINIWGADHQGHIPRLKASLNSLGINPDDLTIIVMQMVIVNGRRMKKTSGNIVTLDEVIHETGPDAIRYNLLSRSADTMIDFDLDLAVQQSSENPVYYIQYAHARCASIFRQAWEKGYQDWEDGNVALLSNESDLKLIRHLTLLPEVIAGAARNLEPHRLAFYAQELAGSFHTYYHDNRILDPENVPLSKARLLLVRAVKSILARILSLMGMNAPDEL